MAGNDKITTLAVGAETRVVNSQVDFSSFWAVLGFWGFWGSAESAASENSKGQSRMRCDMWLLVFLVSDS